MASNSNNTKWTGDKVRQTWLDFWKSKDHTVYNASPVVPYEDKTLLFINSGMCQFKPIFLGTVDPRDPRAKLQRATNTQKCIRAGGKHNDLDDVGNDSYHHTFFEMLGSWSFNSSYFKTETIDWAWELLTKVYGLNPDNMYATYYQGDEKTGIPMDTLTRDAWQKYLPANRVMPFLKDNFWEMGEVGPCGVCTEIHYDLLGRKDVAHLVNRDDPTCIEIWNMVFISFNREQDKSLTSLPNVHVDTGMGFERMTAVLQGKTSNYDSDIFTEIFSKIQEISGSRPYTGKFKKEDQDHVDIAYRIVADHVRTACIAISDGVLPGADGRNYVLRRVLRRSIRYSKVVLKCENLTSRLVPTVVNKLKDTFPILAAKEQRIVRVMEAEERSFLKLLEKGTQELEKYFSTFTGKEKIVKGDFIWRLYSHEGFPHDLVRLIAQENDFDVDLEGFEKLKKKQSDKDRENRKKAAASLTLEAAQTSTLANELKVVTTDTSPKYTGEFRWSGKLLAIWNGKEFISSIDENTAKPNDLYGLILDKTNFYAEMGGQVADIGSAQGEDSSFAIEDCQVFAGYVMHIGRLDGGTFKVGQTLELEYDQPRRKSIMNNHTGTHILNFSLRETLGDQCDQKGSLVDSDKLRFDFSWDENVSTDQFAKIENICNNSITQDLKVYSKAVPFEEAKKVNGLRAVFGETYPDPVIVVSVGVPVEDLMSNPSNPEWRKYAIEFCGGTHIESTKLIEQFVVVSFGSVGSGIKRIVAVTGNESVREVRGNAHQIDLLFEDIDKKELAVQEKILSEANVKLNSLLLPILARQPLEEKRDKLLKHITETKKQITSQFLETIQNVIDDIAKNPIPFKVLEVNVGGDKKVLSQGTQMLTKNCDKTAFLLFFKEDNNMSYQALVPKGLTSKLQAVEWIKFINQTTKGKGGGKEINALGIADATTVTPQVIKDATEFASKKFQ